MIELIVNDLSFEHPTSFTAPAAPDRTAARRWMSQFVSCIRVGSQKGWTKGIRTSESFGVVELAPGYNLYQWRHDEIVDRDERLYFLKVATAAPYLVGVAREIEELAGTSEIHIEGRLALALHATKLLEGIALSWMSAEMWSISSLAADLTELQPDGTFVNTTVHVPNVSVIDHWNAHKALVSALQGQGIVDGTTLLGKMPELFPHIELCGDAPKQIERLTGNERYFAWIVKCISSANDQCTTWTDGDFPHALLPGPATGESATVLNNPKLRNMRVFKASDGKRLLFEHHMKNASENRRMHYMADSERRKVVIAYVGDHLPTALN